MAEPVHRDDLSPEFLEAVREQFPGFKVVCAGDVPPDQLPAEVHEALAAIELGVARSLLDGTCIDCGAPMPGYPATLPDWPDDWRVAGGWRWFTSTGTNEFMGWQCPACDRAEEEDE